MTTLNSTKFNNRSVSILKCLGYLAQEHLNDPNANAGDWYKDDLEIELLESQPLNLRKGFEKSKKRKEDRNFRRFV